MINLNLLDQKNKKEIRFERIYLFVRNLIFLITIFTLFVSVIFFSSKKILENKDQEISARLTQINQENRWIDEEIDYYNKQLETVKIIQDDYIKWSDILIELSQQIPDNVLIKNILIDGKTGNFSLSGFATLRADYLNLENNLKNSSLVKEVNSPLSNILTKNNIDFTFNGKINLMKNND